jgi:hypothetical protein
MEWREPWWPANNWNFSTKLTYTYDPENRKLSELLEMWTNNCWEFFRHKTYTYDPIGNIISETWEDWMNNQWLPNQRYSHSYDASGNKLVELCEVGVVNQWVNDWRWTYSYDTNMQLVSIWHHNWINSSWMPTNGCNVYGKFGDCVSYNLNDEAGNLYKLLPGYNFTFKRSLLINSIFTERVDIANTFTLFQNYPNPFNPITVLSYQLPVSGDVTLKVYDILGNEIASLVAEYKLAGKYEVEFNASALPSGVYFYQLRVGEYVAVKKMLLIK